MRPPLLLVFVGPALVWGVPAFGRMCWKKPP